MLIFIEGTVVCLVIFIEVLFFDNICDACWRLLYIVIRTELELAETILLYVVPTYAIL